MIEILVLGTGCPKCIKLAETAKQAAKELGIEYELRKVTKIEEILSFGVMSTPALVVNSQVKVMGRVPPVDEVKQLLSEKA